MKLPNELLKMNTNQSNILNEVDWRGNQGTESSSASYFSSRLRMPEFTFPLHSITS